MEPHIHNEPSVQASSDGTLALNNAVEGRGHHTAPASSLSSDQTASGSRWLRTAAFSLLALGVVAAGASYGAYSMWLNSGRIAPGVIVQGEHLGGLTAQDARRRLTERFDRLFIEVKTPQRSFKMSVKELGGQPQIQEAVKNAYWFGRSQGVVHNVWNVMSARQNEKRLTLPVRWNKDRLRQKMWTVARLYNQEPQDATLQVTEIGADVIEGRSGRKLNVGETLLQLQKKYYAGLPAVEATVRAVKPRITAANLAGTDIQLGEYRTRFNAGEWGRTRNIYVAAASIDGQVLMPGETFSFNQSTGERTWDKGYRMAHIFERKPGKTEAEVVDGLAGGVCQVSSTLYNAVRKSKDKVGRGLRIVERNYHSLPVTYVPPGFDATVAWPIKDFRFRNSLGHPVYLRAVVNGSRLNVSIWGRVPDSAQVATVPASDTDSQSQNS
ncbi:MAG TPA: VanW family protein [Abditibacteriaceae bacterium]|jgi:vancomycin resistance protein YoaR